MKNKEIVGSNLPQDKIEENFKIAKEKWLKKLGGLSLADHEKQIETVVRNKTPTYKLLVMDMFSYGESRIEGEYHSAEEALKHAKQIVLGSFEKRGKEGYEEWLSFGEAASIIALDGAELVEFSAQDYVKRICHVS